MMNNQQKTERAKKINEEFHSDEADKRTKTVSKPVGAEVQDNKIAKQFESRNYMQMPNESPAFKLVQHMYDEQIKNYE